MGQLAGELNPTPGQVLARTPIMWKKGKFTYYVNGVKKNKADSIMLLGKVIEPLGKGKTITG